MDDNNKRVIAKLLLDEAEEELLIEYGDAGYEAYGGYED